MAPEEGFTSISDASVPNAGRIYDYLLGGNHNFEIDRAAAQQLTKTLPEMAIAVRLIRWFLGEAVRRLSAEGYRNFLDFASGLPTVDHIHYVTPAGTKVLYSDIDPVTVSYGTDIVKELPGVAFVQADASVPEKLLALDIVNTLFGTDHKVAIGLNGIAWFLPDEKLGHALKILYDWAAPGSKLFMSDVALDKKTEMVSTVGEFYKQVNQPVYNRTEERLRELLGKWKVAEPGIKPLDSWLKVGPTFKMPEVFSSAGTMVGMILVKE
jgi:SAM-dependent methyltransferase